MVWTTSAKAARGVCFSNLSRHIRVCELPAPCACCVFLLFIICGGSDGKISNGLSAIVLAGQAAVAATSATGATSCDASLSLPHQSSDVDDVQLSHGESMRFLQALHPQHPPLKLEVLQGRHVSDESCA